MSIVSGLMMGAALGSSLRRFFRGEPLLPFGGREAFGGRWRRIGEPLALLTAIPGRRRYRAEELTEDLAVLLEKTLNQLDFVRSFRANALSKSLLFVYDAADEEKMNALEKWMKRKLFHANGSAGTDDGGLSKEMSAGSFTRSIRRMGRSFSAWVKAHTGGIFDLSALTSLIFFVRGVRKLLMTHRYPSGAQLLWWALSLMRGWRTV